MSNAISLFKFTSCARSSIYKVNITHIVAMHGGFYILLRLQNDSHCFFPTGYFFLYIVLGGCFFDFFIVMPLIITANPFAVFRIFYGIIIIFF